MWLYSPFSQYLVKTRVWRIGSQSVVLLNETQNHEILCWNKPKEFGRSISQSNRNSLYIILGYKLPSVSLVCLTPEHLLFHCYLFENLYIGKKSASS